MILWTHPLHLYAGVCRARHSAVSQRETEHIRTRNTQFLFSIRQIESSRFLSLTWWFFEYFVCFSSTALAAAFLRGPPCLVPPPPPKIPQLALRVKRILNNHWNARGPVIVKHECSIRTYGEDSDVCVPRKKSVCVCSLLYFLPSFIFGLWQVSGERWAGIDGSSFHMLGVLTVNERCPDLPSRIFLMNRLINETELVRTHLESTDSLTNTTTNRFYVGLIIWSSLAKYVYLILTSWEDNNPFDPQNNHFASFLDSFFLLVCFCPSADKQEIESDLLVNRFIKQVMLCTNRIEQFFYQSMDLLKHEFHQHTFQTHLLSSI